MINVPLARKKSTLEHRCNNVPHTGENVAHTQPSVSHEEEEIQNSNFEHVPSKRPSDDPEESTIEDNSATVRGTRLVRAWTESSKYGDTRKVEI